MITIYAQLPEKEFVKSMGFEEMRLALADLKSVFWINLESPTNDEIQQMQDVFDFHPLCIEDCMSYSNSPKLDLFDEYLFLVTHEPEIDRDTFELKRPEIDFFLGKNYLVSIHQHTSPAIEKTIHRCNTELLHHQALMYQKGAIKTAIKDNTMFRNSDFVLHAILDSIVDSYIPLVDRWDDQITDLEERVLFPQSSRDVLNEILTIKRQLSVFRRTLAPQRDVMARLIHSDNKAISKFSQAYFRDVYDHLMRVNEVLDAHRDMMGNLLDAYYSVLSHQINENSQKINVIMQRLTIITTIFMPLSFIAGVYGMNFEFMPELKWHLGYFMALAIMGFVGGGMYFLFRKRKWF